MAGWFNRLLAPAPEVRAISGETIVAWIKGELGYTTDAGVTVTPESAMRISAVYGSVRVITEAIASLALITYRRRQDGGRDRATDHWLYELLHDQPNPEMAAFQMAEMATRHLLLWGDFFAQKQRNRAGRLIGLWPLYPHKMQVKRINKQLTYIYDYPNNDPMTRDQIWHVPGRGFDGLRGKSVITYAREAAGVAKSADAYAGSFYTNGAQPGAVLTHPGELSDEAFRRLKQRVSTEHAGQENAHKTMILEEGMSYQNIGMDLADAQFIETRRFQRSEIAAFFGVPLHMLGDLERATFSNIEHQSLEFVRDTLRPWIRRIESAIRLQLIPPAERNDIYSEFLIDSMLRGDTEARIKYYTAGKSAGWLSSNDIRRLENMNPIDGGDQYLEPMYMAPADIDRAGARALPAAPETRADTPGPGGKIKTINAYIPTVADAMGRILRREANDIENQANKLLQTGGPAALRSWLDQFYADYGDVITRYLTPVLMTFGAMLADQAGGDFDESAPPYARFMEAWIERYADRHIGQSRSEIDTALDKEDRAAALSGTFERWRDGRPETAAGNIARRAGWAVIKNSWAAIGVTVLVWDSGGDACPYCRGLDGVTVEIDSVFVAQDGDYQPAGAEAPLKPGRSISHPPLHNGCNCGLRPVKKGF